jgi:hypothetical protein
MLELPNSPTTPDVMKMYLNIAEVIIALNALSTK